MKYKNINVFFFNFYFFSQQKLNNFWIKLNYKNENNEMKK